MDELCISVIVPIFNAEQYLVKCIDSIIRQTYKNLEILLIDDGSTDRSLDICNEFSRRDDRVVVIHKDNAGLVAARKTGIENATGTYITFVDADDYVDIDTYEILVKKLDSPEVDIVAFGLLEEYPDRTIKKENHYPSMTYCREQIEEVLFPSMLSYGSFFDFGILPNLVCKLIRRSFLNGSEIEVDDCVTVGEDADATFQLLVNAKSVQIIDYAPYHYCKRSDSMMWRGISAASVSKLERDLSSTFLKAGVQGILEKQLEDYITFVSLLKHPQKILNDMNVFKNKKIALYGAGGFGQAIFGTYENEISVWVDSNYQKYESMGYKVYPIEYLKSRQCEYDEIFVAILTTQTCQVVKDNLIAMGITKPIRFYSR
ncbi:MAG: glycosyltransferase [Lachnospiraceae bacterium]|nr:glycosyltransferase [Lachnospiraceae bacterium]